MRINTLTFIQVIAAVLAIFMAGTAMAADPVAPADHAQYRADGTTAITQGGTTDEATVKVKATVTDADSTVQLQVEIIDSASAFGGTPNCVSAFVASGSVATASCSGLTVGTSYKWQARTNDGTGMSAWVAYGGSDPDVTVSSNFLIHNSDSLGDASYGAWGVSTGTYGEFTCETCHTKVSTNIKRVRTSITTPDASNWRERVSDTTGSIVFTQADGTNSDMGDTAAPFNGICNVCHDNTNHVHYSYNASDNTHNVGSDCTACHLHSKGFEGLGCNGCHGASGSTGAPMVNGDLVGIQDALYPITGHSEGAHLKHVTDQGITNCNVCHSGNTMPTVDEVITIGFSGTATTNSSTPSYDGAALDPPYSYGGDVTGPTGATLDCSNVYCHSSVQGTGGLGAPASYATPDWIGGALACDSCHGQDADETDGQPDSGAHSKHAGSLAGEKNYSCSECHSGAGSGTTAHADGTINMNLSGGGTYSQGDNAPNDDYGTCSSVSCHSDGQSSPNYASPAWGDTADCVFCHGGAGGSTGGATTTLTSSHTVHTGAAMGYTCDTCHNTTAADNSTIIDFNRHVNTTVNVAVEAASGGTGTDDGDYSGGSCATTNCHGSASTDWAAGGTTGDCSLCHGMAANPADGRDTNGDTLNTDTEVGAHVAHLNNTHGLRSTGIACSECHTEPLGATYADKVKAAAHIDTALPAEVPLAGALATANTTTPNPYPGGGGACGNTYCHDGTNIKNGWSTAAQIEFATPDWNTPIMNGTIDDCDNCHGNPPAGSHTSSTSCSSCHTHVAANQYQFTDASLHMDGAVIAQQGGACDACHGYVPGPVPGDTKTCQDGICEGKGAHQEHIANIIAAKAVTMNAETDEYGTGAAAAVCGACHTNIAGNHMSGTRMINFGDGSTEYEFVNGIGPSYNGVPGTSSDTTFKNCSNISCHFGETPGWQDPATKIIE